MQDQRIYQSKVQKGRKAYLKGASAEHAIALHYARRGATLLETRWRGQGGEIDLSFEDDGVIVFCEVKAARSAEAAITRLTRSQMTRIHMAAAEYIGLAPTGQLSEVRFDLAVLDEKGEPTVLENAFGHF